MRNFKTGDSIEIAGSIIYERWENDSAKYYKDRVRIQEVSFVPRQYVPEENIEDGAEKDSIGTQETHIENISSMYSI